MTRRENTRLTPNESIFAARFAATGDKLYAAEKAGYAQPSNGAHRALARVEVNAEIARIQTNMLFQTLLPLAVTCLAEIIGNAKAPAGARVQAAKLVLDRTLGADDAKQGKEPHEMTGEELANAIAQLERIASEKARPIDQAKTAEVDVFG